MVGLGRGAASAGIPLVLLPSPCVGHSPECAGGSRAAFGITLSPDTHSPTGAQHSSKEVQLLYPCPRQVHAAVGQQLLPSVPTAPTPELLSSVCHRQWVTPGHHELLIIPPCIFFSTIHHFSINAISPGVAAQLVPYKAGVPEQRLPSPGASTCILLCQAEPLGYT